MSPRLRVVHVIGGLELGGAETLLYRLATHRLAGIEQHVICLGTPEWYSSRLSEHGVSVHHLGLSSSLTALRRIGELRGLLRQIEPDVIQSWMYLSNLLSSVVGRRGSIPVVWGIHNSSFESVGVASRLSAYVGGAAARRLASFVVNCSRHSAELHARLGYSAVPNAIIPNGYDPAAFQPDETARECTRRALGLNNETFVVGSIARWHAHKDVPTLLGALRMAKDAGVPLRCLLVGRELGSQDHALTEAISAADCARLVMPLGPRTDVADLARAFDLHTLSSRSEAFPNVVAETMLSGTPNAVTHAGDAAAIVGDTGWIVPPGSPQKLAGAIIEAYREWSDQRSKWQRRRESARQRIVDHYTFEKMADAYAGIWRKVAADAA